MWGITDCLLSPSLKVHPVCHASVLPEGLFLFITSEMRVWLAWGLAQILDGVALHPHPQSQDKESSLLECHISSEGAPSLHSHISSLQHLSSSLPAHNGIKTLGDNPLVDGWDAVQAGGSGVTPNLLNWPQPNSSLSWDILLVHSPILYNIQVVS